MRANILGAPVAFFCFARNASLLPDAGDCSSRKNMEQMLGLTLNSANSALNSFLTKKIQTRLCCVIS